MLFAVEAHGRTLVDRLIHGAWVWIVGTARIRCILVRWSDAMQVLLTLKSGTACVDLFRGTHACFAEPVWSLQ